MYQIGTDILYQNVSVAIPRRRAALEDAAPWCPWLAGEAARLEEARAAVAEERIECDLALGTHGEAVTEIPSLAEAFPLRERLAGQLMVALWRCGRRGDALAAYDRIRRVLATELGLDPGPELRRLHAQLLADDPSLAAPQGGTEMVSVADLAPGQIRSATMCRPPPRGRPGRPGGGVAAVKGQLAGVAVAADEQDAAPGVMTGRGAVRAGLDHGPVVVAVAFGAVAGPQSLPGLAGQLGQQ